MALSPVWPALAAAAQTGDTQGLPLFNSFDAVIFSINQAFTRDTSTTRFSQALRSVIFLDLSEIKRGLMGIAGNADSGSGDVSRILPDLQRVRRIMLGDKASVAALDAFQQQVLPLLTATDKATFRNSELRPSLAGPQLPRLLQDAITTPC